MSERRRSVRQKTFLRGSITFDGGRMSADCIIRDMTAEGARLILSDVINIPDVVRLDIPLKSMTVNARVKWRRGAALGVTFLESIPVELPRLNDLTRNVIQLQAEVAALWEAINTVKNDLAQLPEVRPAR